jgi:hypothetical protein
LTHNDFNFRSVESKLNLTTQVKGTKKNPRRNTSPLRPPTIQVNISYWLGRIFEVIQGIPFQFEKKLKHTPSYA